MSMGELLEFLGDMGAFVGFMILVYFGFSVIDSIWKWFDRKTDNRMNKKYHWLIAEKVATTELPIDKAAYMPQCTGKSSQGIIPEIYQALPEEWRELYTDEPTSARKKFKSMK